MYVLYCQLKMNKSVFMCWNLHGANCQYWYRDLIPLYFHIFSVLAWRFFRPPDHYILDYNRHWTQEHLWNLCTSRTWGVNLQNELYIVHLDTTTNPRCLFILALHLFVSDILNPTVVAHPADSPPLRFSLCYRMYANDWIFGLCFASVHTWATWRIWIQSFRFGTFKKILNRNVAVVSRKQAGMENRWIAMWPVLTETLLFLRQAGGSWGCCNRDGARECGFSLRRW